MSSLWEYKDHNAFTLVYRSLIEARLLRIIDRNTYKVFIVAGQLYLRFLKEAPFIRETVIDVIAGEKATAPVVTINSGDIDDIVAWISAQPDTIVPDDIVTWLLTQLSIDDTQYSEDASEEYEGESLTQTEAPLHQAEAAFLIDSSSQIDLSVVPQLTNVLSLHFPNGYRLNSPIELTRFRSFAANDLGEELALTDEELQSGIVACGTTYDGKVYAVSEQTKEQIKTLAENYFADGAQVIFFAEFYAKNEDWLFGASVVSEDMLTDILHGLFTKMSFTQTYFGYTDATVPSALKNEILRVWGDAVLATYEQLAKRLQYIPIERIKYALGQISDFIWNGPETFSHISRVDVTDKERLIIRETAARECDSHGYALFQNFPLCSIEERNYELSTTAVHNAVYRICLSGEFDKKCKIVTRKGDIFDPLAIMNDFCRNVDKCSLDDLLSFEKDRTGEIRRLISMEAGNNILICVDKTSYVADRYVHFNADMIDEAIGFFVKGDYLPLKSFTAFGAFPDCGQGWNLFLLESYCRRFSRKFRFDALSVNSRNAGVVIRKSCTMNYTEIITDAVATSNIPLTGSLVGKFLFDNGYTARSTTVKVNEIIDKAKIIRERMD
jgi:hypothetical protein